MGSRSRAGRADILSIRVSVRNSDAETSDLERALRVGLAGTGQPASEDAETDRAKDGQAEHHETCNPPWPAAQNQGDDTGDADAEADHGPQREPLWLFAD